MKRWKYDDELVDMASEIDVRDPLHLGYVLVDDTISKVQEGDHYADLSSNQ